MNIKDVKKEYSNGDITVVWQPSLCIHSKLCFNGLPSVFQPKEKPWVDMSGANTDAIMNQVNKCPSGALSCYKNGEKMDNTTNDASTKVEVMKNGPLLVHGNILVKDKHGNETQKEKVTAFCRCGSSSNKPYCDGTHNKSDFKDE